MNGVPENDAGYKGVFVSRYAHFLDPKKRLTIPAEWREQVGLPPGLYVLPDVNEKCLCVFPASEMFRRIRNIGHHSIADKKASQFKRVIASQSDFVQWDTQGRIRIKDELLDFAGLTDQVVMVGAFDSFQLWNPQNLDAAGGVDHGGIKDAAQYVGF